MTQSLKTRVRAKIKTAPVKHAERLQQLLDDFEVANDLARVPLQLLAEQPARYRSQVMARVGHWSVKAAEAEKHLVEAIGKPVDCEASEGE